MNDIHSDFLYHFRPDADEDRDLEALLKESTWVASLESLNDPYETQVVQQLGINAGPWRDAGVVCYSRSITSPLLWSHYADAHRGFVIVLNPASAGMQRHPNPHGALYDVLYEDAIPNIDDYPSPDLFAAYAARTKPTCWAYEQEVRLLYRPANRLHKVDNGVYVAIVFGARMELARRKQIVDRIATSDLDLRIGRMEFTSASYGVRCRWD